MTAKTFRFYARLHLTELTGLRALSLKDLASGIRQVPEACIYNHTHRFLQQHQLLSPEPPNDFSYWVSLVIGEKELGERLASIDIMRFDRIDALRESIASTIESYLADHPAALVRAAGPDDAFFFMKSISFVVPTEHTAIDLREFADVVRKITVDSLYYHIFESRLRLGRGENDFSYWIRTSLGDAKTADAIARLDPYTHTLDELRKMVVALAEKKARR